MLEHFSWIHGLWLFGAIALEILANVLLKMSNGFKRVSLGAAACTGQAAQDTFI